MTPNSNVRQPTGWPRAATPCDLKPRWAGEFRDFNDWVNFAAARLAGCEGSVGQDVPAICVDAKGRRCHVGKDFHRARDEDAFPVRYFWECEPSGAGVPDADERALIVRYMRHMATLRPADARGLRVIASDVEALFHRDPELNPEGSSA